MIQAGQPGLLTSTNRTFQADGIIHGILATNTAIGQNQATAQIIGGGHNNREVNILFASPMQGQVVQFRVDIFAGVGTIKASMIFMTIALFISFLLK